MSYTLEENVLILFDSGVLKDRIAEMMEISRKEVDDIINPGIECPACKGTGWAWSTETPGLRQRCKNCDGTGQKGDDEDV